MIPEHSPALVVVDVAWPGDGVSTMLRQIKDKEPRSRCLVLTEDRQQQQEAIDAGADVALIKGFPAARLFDIIEMLVTGPEEIG